MMKVSVNDMELNLFYGARVKDAIQNYFARKGRVIPKVLPEIHDMYGNTVAKNGALLENSKLYIKEEK